MSTFIIVDPSRASSMTAFQPMGRRVEPVSQSSVEVVAAPDIDAFASVRDVVMHWLQEKAGRQLPESMFRGETSELNDIGSQRVETVALAAPVFWSARQDDLDRGLPRRTWVTEAALAPKGSSLLLGHRLQCVTFGEAAPFARSIPRFMREVARQFETRLDGVPVALTSKRVASRDEIEDLVDLLTDSGRRHPVIGVSQDVDHIGKSGTVLDADRLASDVFGAAHVYVISQSAAYHLTDLIGRDLSVFHGGVRTWKFPFAIDDTGFSHPLALGRRIANWPGGTRFFHNQLVAETLRFSASRPDAERMLPPFAQVRNFAFRLKREDAEKSGASDRELLNLAIEENARLTGQMTDQQDEYNQLLAAAESERDEALAELARLRAQADTLASALRNQRNEPAIPIPESLSELRSWSDQYLGNGVIVSPRASNGAKKSQFENVEFVYRTLLLLRDNYVPMRRSGDPGLKDQFDAAMKELGLELTPSFSGAGSGEYANEYRVTVGGQAYELNMHLKGNNSRDPRYGFRCYFAWDDNKKAVIVGSIPGHLTTRAS